MITLKTLPQATAQQVFDQVAEHLLKQGKRSVFKDLLGGLKCAYRGTDGTKCAAGCLISDEEYSPIMEESGWQSLVDHGLVPNIHARIIFWLQTIHDGYDANTWAHRLKQLAEGEGLLWKFG